jgi:predicted phage tail protein
MTCEISQKRLLQVVSGGLFLTVAGYTAACAFAATTALSMIVLFSAAIVLAGFAGLVVKIIEDSVDGPEIGDHNIG